MENALIKKKLEGRIQAILKKLPSGSKGNEYKGHLNSIEYFKANFHLFLTYSFGRVDPILYSRLKGTKMIKAVNNSIEEIKKARAELIPNQQNELYYKNMAKYLKNAIGVRPPVHREKAIKDKIYVPKNIDELGESEESEEDLDKLTQA